MGKTPKKQPKYLAPLVKVLIQYQNTVLTFYKRLYKFSYKSLGKYGKWLSITFNKKEFPENGQIDLEKAKTPLEDALDGLLSKTPGEFAVAVKALTCSADWENIPPNWDEVTRRFDALAGSYAAAGSYKALCGLLDKANATYSYLLRSVDDHVEYLTNLIDSSVSAAREKTQSGYCCFGFFHGKKSKTLNGDTDNLKPVSKNLVYARDVCTALIAYSMKIRSNAQYQKLMDFKIELVPHSSKLKGLVDIMRVGFKREIFVVNGCGYENKKMTVADLTKELDKISRMKI